MRSHWFILPLLAAAAATATAATVAGAQTPSPRIGLFAAVNEAKIDGSDVSDISNRTAGAFGAYVVVPFDATWSVQLGGQYTMKGWQRIDPDTRDNATVRLNYFELPLLLRVDLPASTRLGVFLFAGPSVSFRAGCSLSITEHSSGASESESCSDIERATNGGLSFSSVDAGAIFGAGLRAPLGRANLVINGQYELGFKEVQSMNNAKSRTASFGVGLELPVFRK